MRDVSPSQRLDFEAFARQAHPAASLDLGPYDDPKAQALWDGWMPWAVESLRESSREHFESSARQIHPEISLARAYPDPIAQALWDAWTGQD